MVDRRLFLCTIACSFSIFALLYDYLYPFPQSRFVLAVCSVRYPTHPRSLHVDRLYICVGLSFCLTCSSSVSHCISVHLALYCLIHSCVTICASYVSLSCHFASIFPLTMVHLFHSNGFSLSLLHFCGRNSVHGGSSQGPSWSGKEREERKAWRASAELGCLSTLCLPVYVL